MMMTQQTDYLKNQHNVSRWYYKNLSTIVAAIGGLFFFTIGVILYYLVPILLNYPKGMIHSEEAHKALLGLNYTTTHYMLIGIIDIVIIGFLKVILQKIDHDAEKLKDGLASAHLTKIRKRCFSAPYIIYLSLTLIPLGVLTIYGILTSTSFSPALAAYLKSSTLLFSTTTLYATIIFIFTKRILRPILISTFTGDPSESMRIGMSGSSLLQIIPIFIVSVGITSLIGYSRLIEEKGDILFAGFKQELDACLVEATNAQSVEQRLLNRRYWDSSIPVATFLITPQGIIHTSGGSTIDKTMLVCMKYLSKKHGNRFYDANSERQGVFASFTEADGEWKVGLVYTVTSNNMIIYFLISSAIMLILSVLVIYIYSRTLAGDITLVATSLKEISTGETVDLSRRIPVTSNDEISDLVMAFNKVQEREKRQVEIITQQERMASLGQLVGSMAHNLRTPLMAISGSIRQVADLTDEYGKSIDDANVTREDHHEIAKEMADALEPMRNYCSYMSDVITAVKNQAGEQSSQKKGAFTVEQVLKTVDILMRSELQEHQCRFTVRCSTDNDLMMNGNITSLVQIISNLISNAIDAYDGKGGPVELEVEQRGPMAVFIVTDHGHGIPDHVKKHLFRKMTTTKGAKGNGLGLYISFSTIKGLFGGDIRFVSEPDKGTSFFVELPVAKPAEA